jgi:hypothetical protein
MDDVKILIKNIKEGGVLEKSSNLEKYLSRFLVGICKIYEKGKWQEFRLPKDRKKLKFYLNNLREGMIIDLNPVARCFVFNKNWIYSRWYGY